jgi:hypothetical protein
MLLAHLISQFKNKGWNGETGLELWFAEPLITGLHGYFVHKCVENGAFFLFSVSSVKRCGSGRSSTTEPPSPRFWVELIKGLMCLEVITCLE